MQNDVAAAPPDAVSPDAPVALGFEPPVDLLRSSRTLQDLTARLEPLPDVSEFRLAGGEAASLTIRSPLKAGQNEDAVATIPLNDERGLLMVADGLGGHRGGRDASHLMKSLLTKAARQLRNTVNSCVISKVVPIPSGTSLTDPRTVILDEIERANQRLLRSKAGSATTLALVEIKGRRVRSYHIGDSEILIVSQRGRLKYSSISHSPIGYAVESGMLTEEEALFHPDRHLVSNVVGSDQMSVELGPWVTLSPRDTVLLASDGLFDNLMQHEIIECIRKGKLAESVKELAQMARDRMILPDIDCPSKPDDLTILAFRASK
ncbi:PP2C family protein-serine/threonine phosphatase [Planctomicrobium piriforme]|uniref:Serine/threonine protein phosphatase PrpC n=1 Tax=Planctomicrobium piriforme TaxID=1576369 RepID=A0A1I3M6H8_9PLAN|nr:protein phosphatase 2C domain-containing protein [Planctomicrobium piriforme]SFI92644.1 Serine/threonine protein phosphatase PrpC [Planctomicrobium piriforme]